MYLLLCCLYLSSIYYRSEAVSLTCDSTTDVCPDTELTCTCSVPSAGLIWRLPGSEDHITFDDKAVVGSNKTTTDGIFAVVTNNTGGGIESMLIYTATESLVNDTIECAEEGTQEPASAMYTIPHTFAG